MSHATTMNETTDKQRRAARRTALVLGLVALAVFVAFVATAVLK